MAVLIKGKNEGGYDAPAIQTFDSFDKESLACFIYFDTEISVMGGTEISTVECTDRNFCTPHYRNFCSKVDETRSCY